MASFFCCTYNKYLFTCKERVIDSCIECIQSVVVYVKKYKKLLKPVKKYQSGSRQREPHQSTSFITHTLLIPAKKAIYFVEKVL